MKTNIYIVDDHSLIRRGLTALIGAEPDMQVCGQAEDVAKATTEIMKLRPDLVIADISLKGNSGLELVKNIKAFDPAIRVLVLSMHDESIYALRALKAGARAYLMKGDLAEKIVEAIRRVGKGHLYVSENVAGQMLSQLTIGRSFETDSPVSSLSDRELEVVNLIGNGLPTREIATKLNISIKTVETHRAHIKRKVNIKNATQLVQFCVRWVEENHASSLVEIA
ncbi:MAG TPA: response regulator transcription factor [Opitutaceae bacterium]|jgi:DNA-binding NarL/FixJ family response regulator|nr:response regulator transcription factor [Opitutaceae bacterium]